MAYRSLVEVLAGVKHLPRYAAFLTSSSPSFRHSSNNGQQRHWTAALRRRSIVISKSLAMIERRVALFAYLHVNKDAAPEMYRLPIQAGGFSAHA
jgi:hypothetical protein